MGFEAGVTIYEVFADNLIGRMRVRTCASLKIRFYASNIAEHVFCSYDRIPDRLKSRVKKAS